MKNIYIYQLQSTTVNTELLFYSIENNNFKVSKLFLNYGISIENKNIQSRNILEHLFENKKLNSKNLSFILNIKKDTTLITSVLLFNLIKFKYFELFMKIFEYDYFDITFIINILLFYKNKTIFSNKEFQNYINNSNKGIIKLNEKTQNGDYPLLNACNYYWYENNVKYIEIVKLLIQYANKNNIILKLNEKNNNGFYPLLKASYNSDIEIVKLLIEYADKNNIILKLNEKSKDGSYPLLGASGNNIEIVKLLMEYANKNNIILELNEKNDEGNPILRATNIEVIRILIEYANKNNIILKLNEKDHYGYYPLLKSIFNNNIEIVKTLIEYANKNNIILELNDQNFNGLYPLLKSVYSNNIEMVKLLIEYANKNNIILNNK